jgi:integrase/recombinase XerD
VKFHRVVREYIAYKRSLGMVFGVQARNLRIFAKACAGCDIDEVTPGIIRRFLSKQTPHMRSRHYENLRVFYRFAVAREYVSQSPLPATPPKMPPHAPPYIYPRQELKRLFAEAMRMTTIDRDPLFGITFRTLLILLYGAALRRGEAMSLKGADVDLSENLLVIRNTKFGKSRLVPISSQLSEVLKTYIAERRRLHRPLTPNTHFLATIKYPFLHHRYIDDAFRRLCARLGIHRDDGGRFQPRLHDLRHTFVAHRVEAEYKTNKKSIQRLLDALPTYLGHVGLASSQPYLNLTPAILAAANRRFSRYALKR